MDNDDNIMELLKEIRDAQTEHDKLINLVFNRVYRLQCFLTTSIVIIIVVLALLSYLAIGYVVNH